MLFQNYPDNIVILYSKTLNVKVLNVFVCTGLPDKEMTAMELGLAHSLSRYKLKFSPDKIDTMIVQVGVPIIFSILTMNRTIQNFISRIGRNGVVEHLGTHTFL